LTRREILKKLIALGLTENHGKKAIDGFFNSIVHALEAGKKVSIVGFGSWEWKQAKPRKARNPKTGRSVYLASRKVLVFKPSQLLKDKLNNSKKPDFSR
jgi:nucleoid DNA-binding protein